MLNSETVTTRILITGGGGFLGKRLRAAFEDIGVITFSYDILNGEDITNTVQFKDSCLNN
jgi:dTDP-4-dehydrorhamnose reductase